MAAHCRVYACDGGAAGAEVPQTRIVLKRMCDAAVIQRVAKGEYVVATHTREE